ISMQAMEREIMLSVNDFIYPLLITEESNTKKEVPSMPGVYQISLDFLEEELDELQKLGLKAVLLFGIPKEKDEEGTGAYDKEGIVQRAARLIKQYAPNMLVIADT